MGVVTVQQRAGARERAERVSGPVVIDLTDDGRPPVDDEFAVEWQISDPRPRPIDDERAVPSRA
jgi:hypothetical protein